MIIQKSHRFIKAHISAGAATFERDGKIVATARRAQRKWLLRIPGHMWPVTPDMPTARFNQIPGRKITHTPVKAFKSWQACIVEIERLSI